MADPKFIKKEQGLQPGLDYDFLKKKGLEHAQELSGENWTDYNTHDPGVTMLEQLAYALTELGYRSQLNIKDLLASQVKPGQDDTLYTASEILPTNPLTVTDFRKLVLDRTRGVRNVWIQPLNNFTDRKNIQGLYLVFLEVDSYTTRSEEEIKQEVESLLNIYCNLGEAIEEVIVLEKQQIYIKADIEVEKNAIAEQVHAAVMFELEQLITQPVVYHSLEEMLEMGYDVNEIFDGPRLFNGFILDAQMQEKNAIFYNSEMLNRLRDIEGIKSIRYFNLVVPTTNELGVEVFEDYMDQLSGKQVNEVVVISWNSVGKLADRIKDNANDGNFFSYYRDGVRIQLFQKEVDRYLKGYEAKVKLQFSQNFNQDYDFPVPTGDRYDITKYHSIQRHFPMNYGLAENSISTNTTNRRKADIYQLKGYLLFFEQILASGLEQLGRFSELYGLDRSLSSSYFVQVPWDIPGMYELVSGLDKITDKDAFKAQFEESVRAIMVGIDNFYERRQQFIEHLLARFGDDSYQFTFDQFNDFLLPDERAKLNIDRGLSLLENYNWLTGNKARSFNHTAKFWRKIIPNPDPEKREFPNLSVLESRIRMEIGLPQEVTRIATDLVSKVSFTRKETATSFDRVTNEYNQANLTSLSEPSRGIWMKEEEMIGEVDPALMEDISIDEDLMLRGLSLDNYRVLKAPASISANYLLIFRKELQAADEEGGSGYRKLDRFYNQLSNIFQQAQGKDSLEVLLVTMGVARYVFEFSTRDDGKFDPKPVGIWQVLNGFQSEDRASRTAFALRNNLLKWSRESEGFYVVDHVLLRPRDPEFRTHILLNNPNADWTVRLQKTFEFSEVETGIREEINRMRRIGFMDEERKSKFRALCKDKETGEVVALLDPKYRIKSDAQEACKEVLQFLKSLSDFDLYDSTRVKFKHEMPDSPHPVHHYSHTLTILLSSWTARFTNPEFRHMLETLFRKHTPAHLALHFKWIGLDDMITFENMYGNWLGEYQKAQLDYSSLNKLSDQLMTYVKEV